MNSRSQLVLAVVLAIGLAGCAGLSPFDSEATYPDGYNESEITNPETAADQHTAALSDSDNYTAKVNIMRPDEDPSNVTARIDEANDQADADNKLEIEGEELTMEMYHDDNTTYRKTDIPEFDPMYTEEPFSTFKEDQAYIPDMEQWFEDSNFEEAGTVTRDDETLHRYNATEIDDSEAFTDFAWSFTADSIESFNSTVLVDEEGIIRSFTFDITYTSFGETQEMSAEVHISDIGSTTVNEPDWTDEAEPIWSDGSNSSGGDENDDPFGGDEDGTTFSLA